MLRELTVVNFRNLERIRLSPGPRVNVVSGDNGAGKSSLLEAVDFLSRGRTFRTRLTRSLVRDGSSELTVSAALASGQRLGIRRRLSAGTEGPGRTERRLDGEPVSSQAEMAVALPVIVFHAGHLKPARSEARHWRNVLDWGVFHMKPVFRDAWRRYYRALQQRNRLLREGRLSSGPGGEPWTRQMAEQAMALDACRSDYAAALISMVEANASRQNAPVSVRYARGWPREKGNSGDDFKRFLEESAPGDRRVGYTRYGPHRAALRLLWDGAPASERASRGQQKSAVAMLMLAQIRLFVEACGQGCIVVVDDLAAEFDERRRRWLLGELAGTGQQVFVTTTDPFPPDGTPEAWMFHMKHGEISPGPQG